MITKDIARKAIMGSQIITSGELLASYDGRIPVECRDALNVVLEQWAEFKQLVLDTLQEMPLFSRYFGQFVISRLNQQDSLSSPLIDVVFDEDRPIEKRLERIVAANVKGLDSIVKEYRRTSKDLDKTSRDLLAEILVLDFLVRLGFSNIERPFSDEDAHVDVLAAKNGRLYAIEITRKQQVDNWKPIEFGNLEDCDHQDNLKKIRSVLWNALRKKNYQFFRAVVAGTIASNTLKVVAIKTSDYGFVECVTQAEEILENLITDEKLKHIDCVWLIPNVNPTDSRWICG